jgi:hypothetical protein
MIRSVLRLLFGGKKTPERRERMIELMKVQRFELFKRVCNNLPKDLINSDEELIRLISEQINYATASPQFEGDGEEMQRKLKVVFDKLLRNGADKAANELASAVDMRPHYLAMAEQIMR